MSDAPRNPDDDAPTGEISAGRRGGGLADNSGIGAQTYGTETGGQTGEAAASGQADERATGAHDDERAAGGHADERAAGLGGHADEPVTGAPAGAGDPTAAGVTAPGATAPGATARGASSGDAAPAAGRRAAARRRLLSFGPLPAGPGDPRQSRRRRWFVWGIAIAAVIVVVALCAGALSVVSTVNGVRGRAADARAARALRENDCLDLEKRLNHLVPPGSTTGPAARATAVRDENAAVRIYVGQLDTQRDEDAWRQLLDARTVFADALDRQAKSRTPAFYVAPRTDNGLAVADQLVQWSPAQCAGAIRRLAAPEL